MMTSEGADTMMEADDLRERYLEQQFNKVEKKSFEAEQGDIILLKLRKPLGVDQKEIRHINMLAYQSIKGCIDAKMLLFRFFANPPKEETEKEKQDRQKKDSSK